MVNNRERASVNVADITAIVARLKRFLAELLQCAVIQAGRDSFATIACTFATSVSMRVVLAWRQGETLETVSERLWKLFMFEQ